MSVAVEHVTSDDTFQISSSMGVDPESNDLPSNYLPSNYLPSNDLPDALASIVNRCRSGAIKDADDAANLLEESGVTQNDLRAWIDFEHDIRDGYGRRAVALGDNYELMIMSWLPGDFSAIHDHGATQWGAVKCFGPAEHAIFDFDSRGLSTRSRSTSATGEIHRVNHDLIHQMGNSSDQRILTLHLYGCLDSGDIQSTGGVTADARIFDLLDHTIQYTSGGVFYCLPENRINRRSPGFGADAETTLEHHYQMRDRIMKIQSNRHRYQSHLEHQLSRLAGDIARLETSPQ